MKVGNKQNAFLNGEWARHVRRDGKRITSSIRRMQQKKITMQAVNNFNNDFDTR